MSWISDYKYTWFERLAMNVLKASHRVPRHIAFVMDGNRRYARSEKLVEIEGHSRGFHKLADCLRWCLDIGVQEVTTFAFSIENFKRSDAEVNGLFNLAREKFCKLLTECDKLDEHGVCIRVIGNVQLLPRDLRKLIADSMLRTAGNNKLFLNVAFAYTSRDEITQAVETVLALGDGLLTRDKISECLLSECMYTQSTSTPDFVFRTSGETRLSDFLMWQSSSSILYFPKVLWPQLTIWDFLLGIIVHQHKKSHLSDFKQVEQERLQAVANSSGFHDSTVRDFLRLVQAHRKQKLMEMLEEPLTTTTTDTQVRT